MNQKIGRPPGSVEGMTLPSYCSTACRVQRISVGFGGKFTFTSRIDLVGEQQLEHPLDVRLEVRHVRVLADDRGAQRDPAEAEQRGLLGGRQGARVPRRIAQVRPRLIPDSTTSTAPQL